MSRVQATAARPAAPAPAAANPAAPAAAGPGRPKADKKAYREEGSPLLNEWPADFDAKIHKPLQLADFEAQDVFLLHKAEQMEAKAADYRQKAAIFQKFGSAEARKAAEKFQKMAAKLAELEGELAGMGVDANQLASMQAPAAPAAG